MSGLGPDAILVLLVTAAFLLVLIFEKAPPGAVGLSLMLVLPALGVLRFEDAVAGFSNKGVLTLVGLFVIGDALTRTGAVASLGGVILAAAGGSATRILLLSAGGAACVSAFLNDTAVVVIFLPIVIELSRRASVPASHLLMPLAFASLLGGMCTLVGTSTNLIVSGVAEELGARPLSLLSLAPVGVPTALVCLLAMVLLAPRMLPRKESLSAHLAGDANREYVSEWVVRDAGAIVGKRYADAFGGTGLKLMLLLRDDQPLSPIPSDARVQGGDVVMLGGDIAAIAASTMRLGLYPRVHGSPDPRAVELFELAVSPRSPLLGTRIADLGLSSGFGVYVLAVQRHRQHLQNSIGDRPLLSGDLLLVCGDEAARQRLRESGDFYLLAGAAARLKLPLLAKRALAVTGLVMAGLLLQSLLKVTSFPPAAIALLGALLMVALGCVPTRAAYRSVDWSVVLFIAGTLALGKAMEQTGVALLAAEHTVDRLLPFGPAAVASGLVLLCFLFNFLVSHAAVAALFTPVAVAAAGVVVETRGLAPASEGAHAMTQMMLLAVCFGGSMCFATPVAHQVNLMVMEPGGYRFRDYLRFGGVIGVIAWATVSALLAWFSGG